MPYRVVVLKRVKKSIDKIDTRYRPRINTTLISLAINPFQGKKLLGEYGGGWSLRVWPCRIIYRIEKKKLIVLILEIAYRQGVYK